MATWATEIRLPYEATQHSDWKRRAILALSSQLVDHLVNGSRIVYTEHQSDQNETVMRMSVNVPPPAFVPPE